MGNKREKTGHAGIYKRGSSYEIAYRDQDNVQRHETRKTLRDAKLLRAKRLAEIQDGEFQPRSKLTVMDYLYDWVETYQGKGSRGFRESTRKDYRRDIKRYADPFFGGPRPKRLNDVSPRDMAGFVAFLCDSDKQGRPLADRTVRRILTPLQTAFGSAIAEGLIRHNPASNLALPARDEQRAIDAGTDHLKRGPAKALSTQQLTDFLRCCPPSWFTYFSILAATGMRVSESIAIRWLDVELDGSSPSITVRRAYVRGQFGPPKSKYGHRSIPIDHQAVLALRRRKASSAWNSPDDLVFPAKNGEPLRQENLRRRVLKPIAEEAGVPWTGFHTFRHTCATRLFDAGRNATQVQRWLGHSSAAFTLSTYIHLLDDDLGDPVTLPSLAPDTSSEFLPATLLDMPEGQVR